MILAGLASVRMWAAMRRSRARTGADRGTYCVGEGGQGWKMNRGPMDGRLRWATWRMSYALSMVAATAARLPDPDGLAEVGCRSGTGTTAKALAPPTYSATASPHAQHAVERYSALLGVYDHPSRCRGGAGDDRQSHRITCRCRGDAPRLTQVPSRGVPAAGFFAGRSIHMLM